MWRRVTRTCAKAAIVVGCGTVVFDYTNCHVVSRSLRTLANGAYVAFLYKTTEAGSLEELSTLHTKAATAILTTCLRNEGLYIKFGQGLSAVNHVLPPEYIKTLQVLLDNAPQISKEEVFRIIQQETGKTVEEVFESFDEVPVASASIAQVHKARLRRVDGNVVDVAVKVQKPNIPVQIWYDLLCHRIIVNALEYLFELPLTWSAQTIEENLLHEIDFVKEAANADKIRTHMKLARGSRNDIHIPCVYKEKGLLTPKLMVMEWIDAVKLSNVEEVNRHFNTQKIMATIVESFGDMIFKYGTVHSDPHPANVMVRPKPHSSRVAASPAPAFPPAGSRCEDPQIVLIDFGLCIDESAKFRHEYASLFRAMFTQNTDELRVITKEWGIGHADLFASMQLMKPFSSAAKHGGRHAPVHQRNITKKEVMEMQMLMKDNVKHLLENDAKIPRELVFVGRAMNLIRALNKSFGAPVNRVNVLAEKAVASLPVTAPLAKAECEVRGCKLAVIHEKSSFGWVESAKFQSTLAMLAAWFYVVSLYHALAAICLPSGLRAKLAIHTVEEQIEEQEKEFAQHFGAHPLPRIETND